MDIYLDLLFSYLIILFTNQQSFLKKKSYMRILQNIRNNLTIEKVR